MGLRKPKIEAGGGVELVEGVSARETYAVASITIDDLKGKSNFSLTIDLVPGNNGAFNATSDPNIIAVECRDGSIVYELCAKGDDVNGNVRASDSIYTSFDPTTGTLTSSSKKYACYRHAYRYIAW